MNKAPTPQSTDTAPNRSRHRSPWLVRGLLLLALVVLIGQFAIYVHYAIGLMRFPFDYDQGEGFELVDTMLFSQGEWPYRNNEVYPYYASNYPPVFHLVLVPFAWIFGAEYWYGRLVGFLGTLIAAAVIGEIVYREGRHRLIAIMAGLTFLASNVVYHVGPLFRQHMFMVMFEVLAVAVLAHAPTIENQTRRRRTIVVGLLLLLAAGFTKQHAIATCVAVFVFLFLRRPRLSLSWGVVFAIAGGLLFLWIDRSTNGEWYKNIIAANVNTYFPQQFVGLFKQWLRLHWALVVPATLFALYELYFTRLSLYTIWWVAAVGSTVLSGKWGAGDSYFATSIAGTSVLAGIFAARTLNAAWEFPADHPYTQLFSAKFGKLRDKQSAVTMIASLLIAALFLAYGASVIHMPTEGAVFGPLSDALGLESSYGDRYAFYDSAGWTEGYATIGHIPTQQDIDNGWKIVELLQDSGKPAMSEEAAFNLRADLDVITNPTQLKNLYENDLVDPSALIADIKAHRFGVVVFRAQFYPPPVLDAVYEAYYPVQVIPMNGFNYEVWRPGPPQPERVALASALASSPTDEPADLLLSVKLEDAQRWLSHALSYHAWHVVEPWTTGSEATEDHDGSCLTGRFQQAEIPEGSVGSLLNLILCPDEATNGTVLAFDRIHG